MIFKSYTTEYGEVFKHNPFEQLKIRYSGNLKWK